MMLPRLIAPSTFEALDPELRQACIAPQDLVTAESSGALPELDDDDILGDGGTERMKRLPLAQAEAILAAAPGEDAPIPPAPNTAPMIEDDGEDEPQRRFEKTQPFNRALLFGDSAPPRSTQPSAVWQLAPASVRTPSIAPMTPPSPAAAYASPAKPPLALIAAIGGALLLCTALLVTVAVRWAFSTSEEARERQTLQAHSSEAPETTPPDDKGVPVTSTDALPSAPYAPGAKKRGGR